MLEQRPGPGSVGAPLAVEVLVQADDIARLRFVHGAGAGRSPSWAVADFRQFLIFTGGPVAPDLFRRGQALDVLPVCVHIVSISEHL